MSLPTSRVEPENAVVECEVDAWVRLAQYAGALVEEGTRGAQGQGSLQGFRAPPAKALPAVAHGHSACPPLVLVHLEFISDISAIKRLYRWLVFIMV